MRNKNQIKTTIKRFAKYLLYGAIGCFLWVTLLIISFRWLPIPVSSFMIQDRWGALVSGDKEYTFRYDWKPIEEISRNLQKAVIASEDQTFADHYGFDFTQIQKVLDEREKAKKSKRKTKSKSRGASTISQQVAKNLFLWPGHSYIRKGLEVGITVMIEFFWPKQRILEVYLNIAEFGKGTWGAEAAAKIFFKKPAAKLTSAEAALMAVSLPNPKKLRIDKPGNYMRKRQNWVMQYMNQIKRPD